MRFFVAAFLILGFSGPAFSFPADGCEQQRSAYPKVWKDTSKDKAIYDCQSHYSGTLRVKLSAQVSGQSNLSFVPLKYDQASDRMIEDPAGAVLRILLDGDQVQRVLSGKYFASVTRKENSCWIRGDLSDDQVFFMDGRGASKSGTLTSYFGGNLYSCERIK